MSSQIYECRWSNCRQEFKEKDLFQAHIISHLDMHQPTPARDLADYRKAQGYSVGSFESQTPFEYLNTDSQSQSQTQPLESQRSASPATPLPSATARNLSALGLGNSPPFSPLLPSPSLSSKIRSVGVPVRMPNTVDPLDALASSYLGSMTSTSYSPLLPPRQLTPPPTAEEVKLLEEIIRPTTPPSEGETSKPEPKTPVSKAIKRKQSPGGSGSGGVKFAVAETPASKRRKKIPKTPYPADDDIDSSGDSDDAEQRRQIVEETDVLADLANDDFVPASQAKKMDLSEDEDADGELVQDVHDDPLLTQAELESVHSDEWLESEPRSGKEDPTA
ncbi:hypothetical protein FRC17_000997 [Serendipita sp. 399]|nr:hypothetical protein FRC17_000997 [Serendipita sp. 399]